MAYKEENTSFELAMEPLFLYKFNDIDKLVGILLNAAMRIERSLFLRSLI